MIENLPHKEVLCEIENPVCDICGANMVKIGKELVRSELNIVPEQVYVIDYYRAVYKCTECEENGPDYKPGFKKAEAPAPMLKKCQVSAGNLHTICSRNTSLEYRFTGSSNIGKHKELGRTTLANWIIRSSRLFVPLVERIRILFFQEDIIHADETEVRVLKRDGKQVDGVSRQWVFCSGKDSAHKMSLYYYRPTRSAKVVTEILGDYKGYLQTDGYSAYNAAEKAIRVGCWAHAKRK